MSLCVTPAFLPDDDVFKFIFYWMTEVTVDWGSVCQFWEYMLKI